MSNNDTNKYISMNPNPDTCIRNPMGPSSCPSISQDYLFLHSMVMMTMMMVIHASFSLQCACS